MKISVLSGKGGTGKTFVTTNLAVVAKNSTYVDCDVEEPNGHLFLKPENVVTHSVAVKIPVVDNDLCNGCRKCVDFCRFNALAYINKVIVFEELCHSCGGCAYVCPMDAITEKDNEIGHIDVGNFNDVSVISGVLNVGTFSGVPIIEDIKEHIDESKGMVIVDCPPGSGCSVMESIKDADFCLLITEPTVFGIHNMAMVKELVELYKKPYGVIINKSTKGNNIAKEYCIKEKVNILEEIPFDSEVGKLNSNGKVLVNESEKYNKMFTKLLKNIKAEVNK